MIVGRRLQVVGCIGAAFGAVYERKFGRSVGNIDLVAEAGCIGGFQGKGYRIIGGFHLFDGDGCLVGIRRGRFFGGRECCGGRIRRALVGVIGDRRQLIRGFGVRSVISTVFSSELSIETKSASSPPLDLDLVSHRDSIGRN